MKFDKSLISINQVFLDSNSYKVLRIVIWLQDAEPLIRPEVPSLQNPLRLGACEKINSIAQTERRSGLEKL